MVSSLGYPDYFSYQVSDYGMSADEMLAAQRPADPRAQAALPRAAHLGPLRAGQAVPGAGARSAAGALASQSLGAGLELAGRGEGAGRGCRPGTALCRVGGAAGGGLLPEPGIRLLAGELLGKVVAVSGAGGRTLQEEHPCVRVAHGPGPGCAVANERGAKPRLVWDGASRAGARLLLHELYPARRSHGAEAGSQSGLS